MLIIRKYINHCKGGHGFFALLMGFVLLFFSMIPANAKEASVKKSTEEYRLDNGLKLIVRVDRRAPVVLTSIWYKVGGSYEHSGITGLSHMLEHMMFTGTKRYGHGVFDKIINENGGVQNAMTSQDYTMYYQKLSADKLPISFELEADRMKNLVLQQKIFDKEHKVVMEERRLRVEDNPMGLAWERFSAAAYINNPYHHPVIGWMTDIKHLTLSDLKAWYRQWYVPNNAVLVVVGDVEPEKVLQYAKKYFDPLKAQPVKKLKPRTEVPAYGIRSFKINLPAKLPWIVMGYNTPSLPHDKNSWQPYALAVAAAILGGGNSSRLANDLVRGKSMAVSASANYDPFDLHNNLFVITAAPSPNVSVTDLKKALMDEVEKLQKGTVSEEELNRVKAQIIAQNVYQKDSLMYQAFLLGVPEMVGLNWRVADEYVSHIKAITASQVQAVAKEFFKPNRLTIMVLMPQKNDQ